MEERQQADHDAPEDRLHLGIGRRSERDEADGAFLADKHSIRDDAMEVDVREPPKRCTKVIAPAREPRTPARRARFLRLAKIVRSVTSGVELTRLGSRARSQRAQRGSESTHWRTGTCGRTPSTSRAAVSCIRRVVHDGQKPRPLQDKPTSSSSPQSRQRTRAKPWARIPQAR